MMNQQEFKGAENIPRLAMINDIAGFGRCSTTVSLPIISAMQVQVCPVPTSILSNHLGFSECYFDDYTEHMRDYLLAWKHLGLSFDGLYCGFLGSVAQMDIVEEFVQDFQPSLFLLDPVMGDHGQVYSTITPAHCAKMQQLLRHADIITPNITEACFLTDTPYQETKWTDSALQTICEKLARFGCERIVMTGLQQPHTIRNYIWQNGIYSDYETPIMGASRPGTGDIFASILVADALHQVPFEVSVAKASDFVALCIEGSEKAHLPVKEGVLFEKYLRTLIV